KVEKRANAARHRPEQKAPRKNKHIQYHKNALKIQNNHLNNPRAPKDNFHNPKSPYDHQSPHIEF
ncbi:MAG: hypothetical protein P4M11_09485, partial [Candidatus Pacebacteria bacterium]|nr:hypothetical protein [Candidatus Paceibacterota bacterium]